MPDSTDTQDSIHRYLGARVPLVIVQSIEPNRVMEILRACASRLGSMGYYHYSRTEGVRELMTGQSAGDETSIHAALEQARTTFKMRQNINFIFSDVDDLDTDSATSRHFAEMVRLAESHSGSIILVTDKPVWSGLSRLGMSEKLDLPTTNELADVIGQLLDENRQVIDIEWQFDDLRQAAEVLTGITEGEALNVIASLLPKGKLTKSDLAQLSIFKDKIFGELRGIERVKVDKSYTFGGLKNLRRWLESREALMKSDLSNTHLRPPKGVLLVGVPGCGKSLSAKVIASSWDLPLYRLDMSSILGMYVGQSENQLREALETADRIAPCILWIDEIEKGLASGSGDSGTSRRLIGQFLFWLQESTAKVFMVATANDVASLPPELLRKGRFDEMFFVDLPDAADRAEMIRLYFAYYLQYDISPLLEEELVTLADGFSGSDIDAVIHEIAAQQHLRRSDSPPSENEIRAQFRSVVPYSQTNSEDVALIRAWGSTRCVPAGATIVGSGSNGYGTTAQRRVIIT